MAQKVQITLLCDLDDGNVEADETLHFSLGDTTYEVDACGKHAQQIRDGLEPFVAHARKTSSASSSRRRHSVQRPAVTRPLASVPGPKTTEFRSTTAAASPLPW